RTVTYKKVREVAGISSEYRPQYVRGKIDGEKDPYGENNKFGELAAYHDIKAALKELPNDWAIVGTTDALDEIATILTLNKSDNEMVRALTESSKLPISNEAKKALVQINPKNFKTFAHLSIKALRNITPHVIAGATYDKAAELAGY